MATNYPGALDDDSTVGGGSKPAASTALDASGSGHPVHSAMHQNVGDAIEQIQTKLGTGASTPAANKALVSNGTASEWGQITAAMIASGQSPTFTNITGTLATVAQPNITSVGTLTSLTVGGNVDINGLVKVDDGSASAPTFTFDSDEGNGMYLSGTDEIGFATGGALAAQLNSSGDFIVKAGATFRGNDSGSQFPTGSGTAAHIVTALGLSALVKNSSIAADKENVSTDLGSYLTADMIDSVVPKMWNRKTAPGYPEIGPIADDMETISEFLASHGTDANGNQLLMGVDTTAWMSLMTLALQDIRTRLAALEG